MLTSIGEGIARQAKVLAIEQHLVKLWLCQMCCLGSNVCTAYDYEGTSFLESWWILVTQGLVNMRCTTNEIKSIGISALCSFNLARSSTDEPGTPSLNWQW